MRRKHRALQLLLVTIVLTVANDIHAGSGPTSLQPPTIDRQGGPDGYSYRYIDNRNEPTGPTFDWFEIAGIAGGLGTNAGIALNDQTISIPLNGFVFPFYGTNYVDSMQICSNGFVGFGLYSNYFYNDTLPYTGHQQPAIYPFWTDMDPSLGGSIWYYYDSPNQRLIVEWYQVCHANLPLYRHTFQLRMYSSGMIECMYQSLSALNNINTIGIQGPSGGSSTRRLCYEYNGAPVVPADSLAIRFYITTGNILATITGTGGLPVRGAQVDITSIPNFAILTDSLGHALFTNIRTGNTYRIRAAAPGYLSATYASNITVTANQTTNVTQPLSATANTPNPPLSLAATGGQSGRIPLLWRRPTASAYTLYGYSIWHITSTDTTMIVFHSTTTDTSFTDIGLTDGIRYGYYVKALYNEGTSAPSNTVYAYPRPVQGYAINNQTYQWVDLRNRSVGLAGGDDAISPAIALPFRFPFYENSWDSIQCSTNGFIGYHLQPNDAFQRIASIPDPIHPNEIIAGSWLDLVVANDSIRYAYDTVNTRFVITYYHAQVYQNPTSNITMQYILYPNGSIILNYQQTVSSVALPFGVENRTGTSGLMNSLAPQNGVSRIITRTNPPLGTVMGTLHGNPGNTPIVGTVRILNTNFFASTTLPNSQFQFLNVPTSAILIQASAVGYQTLQQLLTVGVDSVTNVNFVLSPIGNSPPDSFAAQTNFDDRVRLSWVRTGGANSTGFRVYRNDSLLSNLSSNTTRYDDSSRNSRGEGILNRYRVSAIYSDAPTEVFSSDTLRVAYNMAPATPGNLTINTVSDSTIHLQWTAPATNTDGTPLVDLAGYLIYRDSTQIGSVNSSTAIFNYTAPNRSRGYNYRIVAFDDATPSNRSTSTGYFYAAQVPWATVSYLWFNSSNWTNLQLRQDGGTWVHIGFTFPFFGVNYDSVFISSNGFLTLNSWQWYPRQCPGFPSTDLPNAVIAPLWDDLDCTYGSVKSMMQNGIFIVSYENVQYAPTHSTVGAFQVRLEPTGTITFSYQTTPNINDFGIGIENADGTNGYQLRLNDVGTFNPAAGSSVAFWSNNRPNGVFIGRTIRGNSAPFTGSQVNVMDTWTASSNANGYDTLRLPAGTWSVRVRAACMVPDTIYHVITLAGNDTVRIVDTLRQPLITTNPASLNLLSPYGFSTTPLTIQNLGDAPLHWSVVVRNRLALDFIPHGLTWQPIDFSRYQYSPATIPNPLPRQNSELDFAVKSTISESAPPAPINSIDRFWTADAFGYTAVDNLESNYPNWIPFRDITSSGTLVVAGDDDAAMTTMDGFSFSYYGNSYTTIRVNTNGVAQFITSSDPIGSRANVPIPTTTATNALMPLWDDLETTVYKYYDTANNVFILEWFGNRYPNQADTVRFEIQFHANSRAILFLYNMVPVSVMSATVGMQGGTGANGYYIQNFYGASAGQGLPSNMNNYGIAFFHPLNGQLHNWLSVVPDSGTVLPGTQGMQVSVNVALDTSYSIGSNLSSDLVFSTNACSTRTVTVSSVVSVGENLNSSLPKTFALHPNFPNPFNPTTEIRFDLPSPNFTRLKIFNLLGREVTQLVNQPLPAGFHSVQFNASYLASGVYFYRLESGKFIAQRKMVVVK